MGRQVAQAEEYWVDIECGSPIDRTSVRLRAASGAAASNADGSPGPDRRRPRSGRRSATVATAASSSRTPFSGRSIAPAKRMAGRSLRAPGVNCPIRTPPGMIVPERPQSCSKNRRENSLMHANTSTSRITRSRGARSARRSTLARTGLPSSLVDGAVTGDSRCVDGRHRVPGHVGVHDVVPTGEEGRSDAPAEPVLVAVGVVEQPPVADGPHPVGPDAGCRPSRREHRDVVAARCERPAGLHDDALGTSPDLRPRVGMGDGDPHASADES